MAAGFDVVVVGRGMVGSAAARHLAEAGLAVALVGPGEPVDRAIHDGPFASHHDEARVTRISAGEDVWARMAAESMARYRDIADRSGIEFHVPCGLLTVPDDPETWLRCSRRHGGGAREVDSGWVARETGIAIDREVVALYEPAPAGLIRPRALVAAQCRLVERAGGRIIDAPVSSFDRAGDRWRVTQPSGDLLAERVLLATGAFGTALCPVRVELTRRPRTVVMAEIPGSVGDRLPSLIHDRLGDSDLGGIYWTPPVDYPDGRRYLKIGGDLRSDPEATETELHHWFRGDGDTTEIAALTRALTSLLPGVDLAKVWSRPCVVVFTATGRPYLGWAADGLAVALGGNGAAAKSSDEIGRLAAGVVESGWDRSYDPGLFTPVFGEP